MVAAAVANKTYRAAPPQHDCKQTGKQLPARIKGTPHIFSENGPCRRCAQNQHKSLDPCAAHTAAVPLCDAFIEQRIMQRRTAYLRAYGRRLGFRSVKANSGTASMDHGLIRTARWPLYEPEPDMRKGRTGQISAQVVNKYRRLHFRPGQAMYGRHFHQEYHYPCDPSRRPRSMPLYGSSFRSSVWTRIWTIYRRRCLFRRTNLRFLHEIVINISGRHTCDSSKLISAPNEPPCNTVSCFDLKSPRTATDAHATAVSHEYTCCRNRILLV